MDRDQRTSPSFNAASPTIQLARQHFHLLMQRSRENRTEGWPQIRAFTCTECKGVDEGFLLKPAVWAEINLTNTETRLCLECAEARLGRKLQLSDFADDVVNSPIFFGAALVEDTLVQNYEPVRFLTEEIVGMVVDRVMPNITCQRCGYEHKGLAKEGGVVCICGNVYHNTGGRMYMFTYVNPDVDKTK